MFSPVLFSVADPVTISLSDGLSNLTTIINGIVEIVAAQPILTAMFIVPLVGAGIGLIRRIV